MHFSFLYYEALYMSSYSFNLSDDHSKKGGILCNLFDYCDDRRSGFGTRMCFKGNMISFVNSDSPINIFLRFLT